MTDDRDPTTTVIIAWLQSISDGVVWDERTTSDVNGELRDVAAAVRDIGRNEWADKIAMLRGPCDRTGMKARSRSSIGC
jgi:hypothetical protein